MRLLTAREHSRQELEGKLRARSHAQDLIEQVLDRLVQTGLQSDERFAESYIAGRVRKGQGPLRIRAELRERGISDSLIEEYLGPYNERWAEELRRVHDSKYGTVRATDSKEFARRARFLEYRGFPADLIAELLLHGNELSTLS